MLIEAEGARLLENAFAFPSCVGRFHDAHSMSSGKSESGEIQQAQCAEKAPGSPAESERRKRTSTFKFNRALFLKKKGGK
jgi:hypothetical protein